MTYTREDIFAAAIAAFGSEVEFDPLQAQNLLFLVDRFASKQIGGPFFDFRAGPYGPIDDAVGEAAESLAADARLEILESDRGPSRFRLTDKGRRHGENVLADLPVPVMKYLERAARWTWIVPTRKVLEAIYHECPGMAIHNVAKEMEVNRPVEEHPVLQRLLSIFSPKGKSAWRQHDFDVDDEFANIWREVGSYFENAMVLVGNAEASR